MEKITTTSLAKKITDEASAYAYMESLRWPNGPVCPHCEHDKAYFLKPANGVSRSTRTGAQSQRRVWKCAACRKQFSVTTGTIFHGSKVSLQTWLFVFFEMCANKNGLAAREVERKYGVAPKTAWFMTQRIREAMKNKAPEALIGTIVADETWIGGEPERMNKRTRARMEGKDAQPERITPGGSRPNQHTNKTPVLSLVNATTGEVRSRVVANVSGATLRKVITEQVNTTRSHLDTDEGSQYRELGKEFVSHATVNHSADQYLDPYTGATTNEAENYFSQLKRSLDGTHHHVSTVHLDRYLAEFDFRHSTRKITDTERVARLMGQVPGRRITYKRVKQATG
jgi:transposase-like protein